MNTPPLISFTADTDSSITSCQAVVLKVSTYLLALPSSAVLKIVPFSSLQGTQGSRFALWQDQPIVLLNLHQLLNQSESQFAVTINNPFQSAKFVVITHTKATDRFAIPVDELPIFQEISISNVQVLAAHHYRSIGGIAKHMVVSTYRGTVTTLLLLDLQHALYRLQIMNHIS